MDADKFKAAYTASRNGTDSFYRHPLVRRFMFSDGVRELADMGCHWMLDIIATEFVDFMRKHLDQPFGVVTVHVKQSAARIVLSLTDDLEHYVRVVSWTTMPDGDWKFFLANDDGQGQLYSFILPSEH